MVVCEVRVSVCEWYSAVGAEGGGGCSGEGGFPGDQGARQTRGHVLLFELNFCRSLGRYSEYYSTVVSVVV